MGEIIVIMGPTGSGKGVQAKILEESLGWCHISTGELLRRENILRKQLAKGDLAPSGIVERLLEKEVAKVGRDKTILLDGFPRVMDEAIWLDQKLPVWGRSLNKVIVLGVDQGTVENRLAQRGREDDSPEAQKEKWREYNVHTLPVIDRFEKQGIVRRVNGVGTEQEVHERIMEELR